MPSRPTVVVAAAVASAVVAAVLLHRGGPDPPPPAPAEPAVLVEDRSVLRPPEFPPVSTDEERIVHWVRTLLTGADDDVAWAVSRLRLAGGGGRRAVRDAAQVALDSNPAFVQQALEFLAVSPEDADVPFALAASATGDPQSVVRAIRLLGARPGPDPVRSARAIAAAGIAGSRSVRLEALAALAKVGSDAAADEALRVIAASPAADAPAGFGALAAFRNERIRASLANVFETTTDLAVRFAVADALVTVGERTPVAWLQSLVRTPPPGPYDYADAALGALAKVADPTAVPRIGATLADPLAGTAARVTAIRRLETYPLADRRAWLDAAAGPAEGDDEVRMEALVALVRAGAADALDSTLPKLVVAGDDRSASVGALVYGRLRRPEAAAPLTQAVARADLGEDARALCLRALVLSGAPSSAATIARAIAADHGPPDAPASPAHNAVAMLGDAGPGLRDALAPEFAKALAGEFGALSGAGLVETVRAAGLCCGPEASAGLAVLLGHADPEVRANAALALGYAAGPDTERDLRAAWWRAADPDGRAAIAKAMERAHFRAPAPVR